MTYTAVLRGHILGSGALRAHSGARAAIAARRRAGWRHFAAVGCRHILRLFLFLFTRERGKEK